MSSKRTQTDCKLNFLRSNKIRGAKKHNRSSIEAGQKKIETFPGEKLLAEYNFLKFTEARNRTQFLSIVVYLLAIQQCLRIFGYCACKPQISSMHLSEFLKFEVLTSSRHQL